MDISPYAVPGKGDALREKSRNAYVLFYERVVQLDSQKLENYKEEESEIDGPEVNIRFDQMKISQNYPPLIMPMELSKNIQQDNMKFFLSHYLFNPNYHSFITKLFFTYQTTEDKDYENARLNLDIPDSNIEMLQYEIKYFLTIGLRAQDKSNIPKLLKHLQEACCKNIKFCLYVAVLFTNKEIIREVLSENPLDIIRHWIAELLKTIFQRLYIEEHKSIKEFVQIKDCCTDVKQFREFFNIEKAVSSNRIEFERNNHSIPYILMVINQIIQELYSTSELQNGCLYEVLVNFAELGEEAILYLNQAQIPGAALEHLHFGKAHHLLFIQSKFIQIHVNTPSQIGMRSLEFRNNFSKFRELILAEQSVQILHFLFLILNKTKEFTSELKKNLDKLCAEKVLDSILAKCFHRKSSLNYFAKIIASLSANNEAFSKSIIEYILIKLQTQESNKLRLYFRIAHFLLQNKNMQAKNIEQFINFFATYFKLYSNIYRISECYIDFIIKECRSNEVFLNTLQLMPKGLSLLKIMDRWLSDNPCPLPSFRGTIFRTKSTLKMSESFSSSIKTQYNILTKLRREALRNIKLGKIESEYDSEEDFSATPILVDTTLDVSLSPTEWVPCQIVLSTEKVILVKYFQNKEQIKEWVEIDSDIIAPANTQSKNLRYQLAAQLDSNLNLFK